MIIIENAQFNANYFDDACLCIFAIGYENRSYYLYDQIASKLNELNTLIFTFDDYQKYDDTKRKIEEIAKNKYKLDIVDYSCNNDVQQKIVGAVKEKIEQYDTVTVHIDYSSMPRSWYCKIPILLQEILRINDKVYFWYSEGEYPETYEEFPSAGIEAFSYYSGKPSLQVNNNRIHVLALGYDVVRTQAITSILDPDYLVTCYAYNPDRKGLQESIKKANNHQLSKAAITLALHINDFSFMVSKLRETANELLPIGDIVLIPDGPKPLIFAISLVPDLLNKQGISCLHIARNKMHYKPIIVMPTGSIYGFSIQINL